MVAYKKKCLDQGCVSVKNRFKTRKKDQEKLSKINSKIEFVAMEPLSQATTPSHVVMKETIPLINKPSRGVFSG